MSVLVATRRQWWFRTLLVVGVLAGVLGMHGLTSGHAVMPMSAGSVMVPGATFSDGAMASHSPISADRPAATLPSDGHAPTGGHSMTRACLAILAAAVALLVLLLRRERVEQPLLRSVRSTLADVCAPRTSPRALALTLHQLSICRT